MNRIQLHRDVRSLVIINNLDVECVAVFETETKPPLIVDSNTVLTIAITFQNFESIARRHPQKIQRRGRIRLCQFALRSSLNRNKALDPKTLCQPLRLLASETLDHN